MLSQAVSFESSVLQNGSVLNFRGVLSRQMNKTQSVGISWGQTISNGITGDIQGFLALWQATFGRALVITASGGIRPYTLEGRAGHQFAPGGGVGVNATLPHGQSVLGRYERAVEQAYGFNGTHLAHRFVVGYEAAFNPRVSLNFGGTYGINTYPLQPDFKLNGKTLSTELRYTVVRNLAVGAGYGLWISRQAPAPSVTTYRTNVSLYYAFGFR